MGSYDSMPGLAPNDRFLVIAESNETGKRGQVELGRALTTLRTNYVVWDDLRFPATSINPPGQVSDPDWDTTNGGWLFDATGTETIFIVGQLPHTWKEGSEIRPHVHWQKTTSAAGAVLWQFDYKNAPIGEVMDAGFTTMTGSVPEVSDEDTADLHAITPFGDVDMTGRRISHIFMMKVSRIGGNVADTYAADARLLEFDIHFQIDAAGSITGEFIK